jgi:Mg2+-importing ATPase
MERRPGARELWSWTTGVVLLAALLIVARRSLNPGELAAVAARARLAWLLAALVLQAATYAAQGQVWRAVSAEGGLRLGFPQAARLSLAKLFVDQTLPSAGVSGTVYAARALERLGLPREAGAACVAVNLVSYYVAYAAALGAAALIAALHGRRPTAFLLAAAAFLAGAALLSGLFAAALGRSEAGPLARLPLIRGALDYVAHADPRLLRSPLVFAQAAAMQLGVILLDAATLWTLLLAVRWPAPPARVFACFMAASIFRSVGLSPGGLGAFEAACVVTLKKAGVPVPEALSATLLFRALSFWLPMAPGLWATRAER